MVSRSKYATFNMTLAVIMFFITGIMGLVNRMVLLPVVGAEIVGLSATFSDILAFLNFADIGLSTAIGASLFEPIHNKKYERIHGILLLFKKMYRICGYVFTSLVLITTAIFLFAFKNPHISAGSAAAYFLLTAMSIGLSYFFSYRLIIINTDQSMFKLKLVNVGFKVITIIIKLILLVKTKSFTVYLISDLILNFVYYIVMNQLIKKVYIKAENAEPDLDENTKSHIFKTVKGLVFHKIGEVAVYGTNNLYTAIFSGFVSSALLSNYMLVTNMLSGIITNLFAGFNSSLGNLVAIEKPQKCYSVFRVIFFMMTGFIVAITVAFINCVQPFISLCFGSKYLLNQSIIYMLAAYFFVMAIRPASDQFKTAAGIFYEDRYVPIIEAIINAIASVILGYHFGVVGVIAGNVISTVSILSWQKPYMVFKYVFKTKLRYYFIELSYYIAVGFICLFASMFVCNHITTGKPILDFLIKGFLSVIISLFIWILVFCRTKVFKKSVQMLKNVLPKILD